MARTRLINTERNLVKELAQDPDILHRVKDNAYAHKLYAAITNTAWQPDDVIDILKDATWSASWRAAGSIVADLRGEGDYLDWYCSGNEGYVHEDIRQDFKRLGWVCVEEDAPIGEEIEENRWGRFTGIAGAFSFHRFKKK